MAACMQLNWLTSYFTNWQGNDGVWCKLVRILKLLPSEPCLQCSALHGQWLCFLSHFYCDQPSSFSFMVTGKHFSNSLLPPTAMECVLGIFPLLPFLPNTLLLRKTHGTFRPHYLAVPYHFMKIVWSRQKEVRVGAVQHFCCIEICLLFFMRDDIPFVHLKITFKGCLLWSLNQHQCNLHNLWAQLWFSFVDACTLQAVHSVAYGDTCRPPSL